MTAIQGTLQVELEGRGPLTLRSSNYVATGGEGSVYRASDTMIKLYSDAQKMRRDGMADKIRLLSGIKHPYIVAPKGLVISDRGDPIGFYMPFADGEPLPRVFTSAFWQRESFTSSHALILVDRMRDTIRAAHDHRAIMVDANELNWLAFLKGKGGPEPRAIDVDSWAVGKWKATVIMPSIRDLHAHTFDERTDWFAFGVVSFQILTGIHPYRGTLDGYKAGDLEARMRANASVFRKGVSLNRAVRDFSSIPPSLLEWYRATFENGERSTPPSAFDKGVGAIARPAMVRRVVTSAGGALVYDKLFERAGDAVVRVFPCGVVLLASGTLVEVSSKKEIATRVSTEAEVVRTMDGWLIAYPTSGGHDFVFVDRRSREASALPYQLRGIRLFRYENRLFLVTEGELVELVMRTVGKPILASGKRTPILRPHATNWFDGVGVQKAFDATFLVLPFGESALRTVRIRELDGLTPITGRAGNRFVTVIGADKNGTYHRCDLTFASDYGTYTASLEAVDGPDLNVALLPKGVGASIQDDGELTIFVPTSGVIRPVKDKDIATDMTLAHMDDTVVYVRDGALWSVKLT